MGKHTPGTSEYSDKHSSSRDSTPHVRETSYHKDGSRDVFHRTDKGSESMAKATREHKQSQRSGGGGGRVICTHFVRKGMLSVDAWRTDMEYTQTHLSSQTVRGYQYWAIPYVRLMRRSKLAEQIMLPLATWRAEELAFKQGKSSKPNYKGKLVRLIGEPISWFIGVFVGEQDWQVLWDSPEPKYRA